jgi:hypothetical protein
MKHKKRSRPNPAADDENRTELGQSGATAARIGKDDVATEQGTELETGGQAGDLQQISRVADADSESVAELIEEGQAFEAGVISGVEDAPDADAGEVRTKEVPEDDIPPEYRKTRETD